MLPNNSKIEALHTTAPISLEKLRRKPFNKANVTVKVTLLVIAVITFYALFNLDNKYISFGEGMLLMFDNFRLMFTEPHFKHFTFGKAVYSAFITLGLAVLTTILGSIIAFGLSLLAARNLSGYKVSSFVRALVAVIRAVPTILWVLIFAVSSGLGSVAAVIGMTWHTISYLTKAYSEAFEEIDSGTLEALKASGANRIQIVFQAVFPSSLSYLISWTFLRLEMNFSNALAMGAAAGAGGLGYDLYMAGNLYYDIREIGSLTYFILFFAIVLEISSMRLKNRLRQGSLNSEKHG